MPPLSAILTLARRRWALPIVGLLHTQQGSRFATLCYRLDGNPGAVRQSIDHLIAAGLVVPNPGYGHPLRPEYILTPRGAALGPACSAATSVLRRLRVLDVGLRRWSLPLVAALAREPEARFTPLLRAMGDATPRAASICLRNLTDAGLVQRSVLDASPPVPIYALTHTGRELAACLPT